MKYFLPSVVIYLNLSLTFGANILVFFPLPFHSHTRAFKPLFKELALRGHNVTFYTGSPFTENIPNLKQVVVRDVITEFLQEYLVNHKEHTKGWKHVLFLWEMGIFSAETLYKEPQIQDLIQSTDSSFDLILLETFFVQESFAILGHKFDAPIINLHPFRAEEWISDILRNPQPLSYVPNLRLPVTGVMNFYERTVNTIYSVFQSLTGHYYYIPALEKIIKKYVKYNGSKNLPPLLELLKNTSLTLLDGNSVVSFSSPNLPNFIPVGGIHISTTKKLPENIEKFINESVNGIVYFSLGSHVQVSNLPSEKLNIIAKVLGNLPQKVLLKWEIDGKMPGQPTNVMTLKWLPQLDILAHPKCRAFITHGGFHSVLEAAYFGIPIVGLPVFADQENNVIMSVTKGFGQLVKLEDITVEVFSSAINKILNDPSYKKKAEMLSKVIKDVPMSRLDTAVFWVEHVLRHRGAPHLQIAGKDLPWFQYYLLDIIFVGLLVITLIIFFLYKLFKTVYKLFFGIKRSRKVYKSKKSKKE